jgi:tetratricopeptide (TPR) repeat protein
MKRLIRGLIALAAVLICAAVASAQDARISGQVVDKDGKPWPGITVSIKSDENGRTMTVKSDKEGKYAQIGLMPGVYTFTLTGEGLAAPFVEKHQLASGDNTVDFNFKALVAQSQNGNSEAVKQQKEQQDKFKEMQTHFNAGRAALDDYDATRKQLATTPADQKQALQDKMATDAKTAVSEMTLAEQGVQPKDVKNHAVVWSNLAQAYDRAGEEQEAVDAYQKAIDLQPSAGIYQNQSTALATLAAAETDPKAQADKLAQATTDCEKAASLDPNNTAAALACWKNIGIILTQKGDFKDAVVPLQKATTMAPKDAQAWFLLGSAYTGLIMPNQQGDKITYDIPPGTAVAYQKVIDIDPNGPYAAQAKQNLDALAAMAGGDATSVGVRPKKKKS